MASALALIFILLVAGYAARRFDRFPEAAADAFNRFIIDVCVPATILRVVPKLAMRADLWVLIAVPWTLALLAFAIARGAARLLRFDRATETVVFLTTALSNTSFLGFPMCKALLGESSLSLAAVYDQLGSFLLLCLVAPLAIARAAGTSAPTPAQIAQRVLVFPPFLALLAAFLPLPHPAWLDAALFEIGSALVPLAMFAVGLRLRITPPKQTGVFALCLIIKLAIMPLVAWGIAWACGAKPDMLRVAVLQSAMPSMISAGALLVAAGLAPMLVAALVGWGLVIALVSVPAWSILLHAL